MVDLRNTIAHILEHKQHLVEANEDTTQQYVILPILRALGWDDTNLASMEVLPEHAVKGGSVDYALKVGKKLALFIECKRWSEPLERHEDQIVKYAFEAGVRIVSLTDGKIWRFYFSWIEGIPVSERIFCETHIENREDAVADLEKYLLKANVMSGKAERNAEIALEEKKADTSKSHPIDSKMDKTEDVIDNGPVKKGAMNAGKLTIAQVKGLVPQKIREEYESRYTEERYSAFYRRVTEIMDLVEKEGWKLQPDFTRECCNFWLGNEDRRKKRRVFGIAIIFNPPRFHAKITAEEAEKLSREHECKVVWYDRDGKNAFYIIPESLMELLPVLEFTYNKHCRG